MLQFGERCWALLSTHPQVGCARRNNSVRKKGAGGNTREQREEELTLRAALEKRSAANCEVAEQTLQENVFSGYNQVKVRLAVITLTV